MKPPDFVRQGLLLFAVLVVTVTYQAGLNPPGGLWKENATDVLHHYRAGDPILHTTYPRRYQAFFYLNATSFVVSLVILILLLSDIWSTRGIKYYAAGSCRRNNRSLQSKLVADRNSTSEQEASSEYHKEDAVKPLAYYLRASKEDMLSDYRHQYKQLTPHTNIVVIYPHTVAICTDNYKYNLSRRPAGGPWSVVVTYLRRHIALLYWLSAALIASKVSSLRAKWFSHHQWWVFTLYMFCIMGAYGTARSCWTMAISALCARDPATEKAVLRRLVILTNLVAMVNFQDGLTTMLSSLYPQRFRVVFLCLYSMVLVACPIILMLVPMRRTVTCHGYGFCLWVLQGCMGVALIGLTAAFAIWSIRCVVSSVAFSYSVDAVLLYYGLEFRAFLCKAEAEAERWNRRFGLLGPSYYSVFDTDHQLLQTSRMNLLLLGILLANLNWSTPVVILILLLSNKWRNRKNKCSPWQVALTRRNHFTLIPYATRYFRKIRRSCLELLQSNPIAEKNTERGALSKDKEDAIKPLGSVEVVRRRLLIFETLVAAVTFQAVLTTDGEHLLCLAFMASLILLLLLLAATAMACHGQSCSTILGFCSGVVLFGLTDAFTIWSSICFSALVGAILLCKPLHQVVAFLRKPLENWDRNSQETLEKCSKHWDAVESEDHRHPLLPDDPQETVDALLLGILAATTTYLAGLELPGGLWKENATDGLHHYRAGDPILHSTYHRRYLAFFYWNAISFAASLFFLMLLNDICSTRGINYCAFHGAMTLDLLGLIGGACAAGSCSESADPATHKEDPNRPINRNNPRDQATWRVACAAPHHMTGDQSLLLTGSYMPMHDGDDGEGVFVPTAGNGGVVPLRVRGSGSVRTECIALDDVWYVPGLDSNLVSTGQLARQGCAVSLGAGGCRITRGGALVGTARFTEASQFELDFLKVAHDASSM